MTTTMGVDVCPDPDMMRVRLAWDLMEGMVSTNTPWPTGQYLLRPAQQPEPGRIEVTLVCAGRHGAVVKIRYHVVVTGPRDFHWARTLTVSPEAPPGLGGPFASLAALLASGAERGLTVRPVHPLLDLRTPLCNPPDSQRHHRPPIWLPAGPSLLHSLSSNSSAPSDTEAGQLVEPGQQLRWAASIRERPARLRMREIRDTGQKASVVLSVLVPEGRVASLLADGGGSPRGNPDDEDDEDDEQPRAPKTPASHSGYELALASDVLDDEEPRGVGPAAARHGLLGSSMGDSS